MKLALEISTEWEWKPFIQSSHAFWAAQWFCFTIWRYKHWSNDEHDEVIEAAKHVFAQLEAIAQSTEAPVIQDWGRLDRLGKALKAYDELSVKGADDAS